MWGFLFQGEGYWYRINVKNLQAVRERSSQAGEDLKLLPQRIINNAVRLQVGPGSQVSFVLSVFTEKYSSSGF